MLKRVVITNYLGESMEYKIDGVQANNPSGLIITSIDGLGPVKANINMTELTTTDGQSYNSARLEGRNIIIKALFTHASSIEEARLLSYKFFPIKKKLKFRIETDNRIGETEGYVESNEPDIFSDQSGCQISVICESAFFSGGTVGFQFSDIKPLFKFPFENPSLDEKLIKMGNVEGMEVRSIEYDGDYETGIEMTMTATDEVYNPVIYKDGDQKHTSINTNKMRYAVPNTATGETIPYNKAVYTWDATNGYEFFCELPTNTYVGATAVVYKNELYRLETTEADVYSRMENGHLTYYSIIKMYKWDEYIYSWREISSFEINNMGNSMYHHFNYSAIEFKDCIYFFKDGQEPTHFLRWNGVSWDEYAGWSSVDVRPYSAIPVVFNDKLYLVGRRFPGDSYSKIIVYNEETNKYEYTSSSNMPYNFYNGSAVVYNDTIHILGDEASSYSKRHYKLNGTVSANSWSSVSTMPYDFYDGAAVVYNNEIHIFGRYVNNTSHNQYENKHYKWTGSSWVAVDTIPYYFGHGHALETYEVGFGDAVVFDNKIYLFGTSSLEDTCPAPPNNTHLIKDDQIIFNTVQGKKSLKLIRNHAEYNILNALDKDPNWFVLTHGNNEFIYTAGVGRENIKFTLKATKLYEGV